MQPFVKVTVELIRPGTRPRQLGKSFTTDIAKPQPLSAEGYAGLLKLASWKSEKDPTGASICLGDFSKNMKDHEIADRRSSLVINMQTINDIAKQLENYDEKRVNPDYVFIKFQVFNQSHLKKDEPTLLGQSLMHATKIIDLDKIWSSQQVVLLLPKEEQKQVAVAVTKKKPKNVPDS